MTSYTTLVEFCVVTPLDQGAIVQQLKTYFQEHNFVSAHNFAMDIPNIPGFCIVFLREDGSLLTARGYPCGLITLDLHEWVTEGEEPTFTPKVIEDIKDKLSKTLNSSKSLHHPAIRRGEGINCYYPTLDGRIVEYDFSECVYEADSPYQNIKIMKSGMYGNMLILDNDLNIGESDLAYTQAIMGNGKEEYKDKTVLILGGGDGGILHELLQKKPKHITMVDIDRLVIEAAPKHLRGICGDSLDQLKGDNYEVLIEDCIPIMEKYGKEGKKFDFVINDLTAIPVTSSPVGDQWDFLRLILDMAMKVLSPSGKYFTQGNSANMKHSLEMYELQLRKLSVPVDFKTKTVCVPSYMEMWVFYEIWKTG